MKHLGVLAALLLLPGLATAQTVESGPEVVMLVHHPFPDDADVLGVPFTPTCTRNSTTLCDAFAARHGGRDVFRDGFAYPGFVADGRIAMDGLPGAGDVDATLAAYDEAVQQRLRVDTPLTLTVGTRVVEGELRASLWHQASTDLAGDDLRAWIALVEDPVHYRPPPELSNGVFEHPFTVRYVEDLGPVAPRTTETRIDTRLSLEDAWDTQRLRLAFWIEQDADALGRFEPNEVVQAVSHPVVAATFTQQVDRAVLVEAYSATWCDPCLFGDEALERLAEAHGHPVGRLDDASAAYFVAPRLPWPLVVLGAVAAGLFLWRWRPEGRA